MTAVKKQSSTKKNCSFGFRRRYVCGGSQGYGTERIHSFREVASDTHTAEKEQNLKILLFFIYTDAKIKPVSFSTLFNFSEICLKKPAVKASK
ncbi:MAG: hypothetical protein LPK19_14560 [Hymenobacteraceae bacterium]|nr:hypothetical protein [Hymenobacteraceae bacterium]MDX5397453.1 hypothetical protein [Hymenobacteraceae bacterium]MDX5513531.1 hypothetical protein [Hymenobacteraceae bacterium]